MKKNKRINIKSLSKKQRNMIQSIEYANELIDDCIALVHLKDEVWFGGEQNNSIPVKNTSDLKNILGGCYFDNL